MSESKNNSQPEPEKQEKVAASENLTPVNSEKSGAPEDASRPAVQHVMPVTPETAKGPDKPVPPASAGPIQSSTISDSVSEKPAIPAAESRIEPPVKAVVTQGPVSEHAPLRPAPEAMFTEHPAAALPDAEAERRIRRMSRRSFVWAAAAVAGTYFGVQWLGTRGPDNGIPWPFRRLLDVNENLSRDLFSTARLAPKFDPSMAETPRENGTYGVADAIDPDWKLHLIGLADMSQAEDPAADAGSDSESDNSGSDNKGDEPAAGDKKGGAPKPPDKKAPPPDKKAPPPDAGSDSSDAANADENSDSSADVMMEPAVMVAMDVIRALHKTEMVTELKCIEGWSTIVRWGGVRFVDFMMKYPPATSDGKPFDPNHLDNLPKFVSLETPDGVYYVGLDMASAIHPQTLLCYEMNGKPLGPEHGAPLRLAIPVKYGIKNIKNIGVIKFTNERPRDYWAREGYDWYAGH